MFIERVVLQEVTDPDIIDVDPKVPNSMSEGEDEECEDVTRTRKKRRSNGRHTPRRVANTDYASEEEQMSKYNVDSKKCCATVAAALKNSL